MKVLFSTLFVVLNITTNAQTKSTTVNTELKQPKLIVGVVVDQMRHDYIYRYWNRFGNGGFKKLVNEGFFFRNAHYNYVPTYTGPGHASIYTGTTPSTHGIISNDWFVKETGNEIYCTEDKNVKTVGSDSKAGLMSSKNLLVTTIGDELKLATNQQAKVFGVSLKDRASILPAGHSANGAFWFDGSTGTFISSTHYMKELPKWLIDFNKQELAKKYLEQGWNTLYPINIYTASISDNNPYEESPNKKAEPVFPYEYKSFIENKNFGIIKSTPQGNTLTKDLAIECIKAENLGKDNISDLLCVSFSATDYVGHSFAPRSVEVEDVYLRLDKDIEALLNYLNTNVGKENYVLFLTADHGGADNPNYLKSLKIPAEIVDEDALAKSIFQFCKQTFKDTTLIRSIFNQQIYLDENKLSSLKLNKLEVEQQFADYLLSLPAVAEAYPSNVLKYESFNDNNFKYLIQKGYNHKRSGNIAFVYQPGWESLYGGTTGTTHGASYSYDTHIPILFYGKNINKGESAAKVNIVDIAPTISTMLHISFPNGTTGKPLVEVVK